MIEVGQKAKIKVHWNVLPFDYTQEKINEIKSLVTKKYNKSKDDVDVVYKFILPEDDAENNSLFSRKTVEEIQKPECHKELFKKYLEFYHKDNYDYDIIDSIDSDINSKMDYDRYEKYRKFSIKWVRWSNFESYGGDNFFDFTTLNGLVLLNGEPANQSGKTTFAVDLLHFILFGKSGKYSKLEDLFNKSLESETQLFAEACMNIDGEDYIIKRTLTRPALEKRTSKSRVVQKPVEYYRVVGDTVEGLCEYVEENGVDTRETNKIIRESIGNEKDFDLMMCITGKNLDALIDDTPTNRGVLLSRWVGLLPIEEKFKVANEKFKEVKQDLSVYKYNKEELETEIAAYKELSEKNDKEISDLEKTTKKLEEEIEKLEKTKIEFVESKKHIDNDVLRMDITTVNKKFEEKKLSGMTKNAELIETKKKIEDIGEVKFSVDEYDKLTHETQKLTDKKSEIGANYKVVKAALTMLKEGEICPTCHRKLDNVDNSKQIKEKEEELSILENSGKKVASEINAMNEKIKSMEKNRNDYIELNKLIASKSALEAKIEMLRSECKELIEKRKKYEENKKAIDENNAIDQKINIVGENIKSKRQASRDKNELLSGLKADNKVYKIEVEKREKLIKKLDEDEKLNRNWKIYLEMLGKDGVSKMILREMLPVVNEIVSQLLDDVCDFSVNVEINDKNDIQFNLIRDGLTQILDSGSGFERTVSALALRSALSRVSTISRMNFLVFDEILGRVAKENYDAMKLLFDRILEDYDFIFNITHIDDVRDWHDHVVTVTKTNGVSRLQQLKNSSKKYKETAKASKVVKKKR